MKGELAFCTYLINVNIDTKDLRLEKKIMKSLQLKTKLENMNLFLLKICETRQGLKSISQSKIGLNLRMRHLQKLYLYLQSIKT